MANTKPGCNKIPGIKDCYTYSSQALFIGWARQRRTGNNPQAGHCGPASVSYAPGSKSPTGLVPFLEAGSRLCRPAQLQNVQKQCHRGVYTSHDGSRGMHLHPHAVNKSEMPLLLYDALLYFGYTQLFSLNFVYDLYGEIPTVERREYLAPAL